MYALKARDRLHKREKEAHKKGKDREHRRSREQEASPHPGRGAGQPSPALRYCKYIGTVSIQLTASWRADISKTVRKHLSKINVKRVSSSVPVAVLVSMDGVKVSSTDTNKLIMAHALRRVVFSTADTKKSLFALVARNPTSQTDPEGVYCHVFQLPSREAATDLSDIVGKAFKAAFARQSLERDQPTGPSPPGGNAPGPPMGAAAGYPSQYPGWHHNAVSAGQSSAPARPWSLVQTEGAPTAPPWTVQSGPSGQGGGASGQGGGASRQMAHQLNGDIPIPGPALSPTPEQEAGQLEEELLQLHSRIRELESQLAAVGGDEGAALQITIALSSYEQKAEEKRRRLDALQHAFASTAPANGRGSGGRGHPQPSPAVRPHSAPDMSNLSLEDAEWFQAGLPREIAMEVLSQQGEGAFLVRESASSPGSHALSLKAPQGKIVHYMIQTSPNGVNLQGSQLVFPDLVSLIMHHCSAPENLPCTLSLATSNPTFLDGDTPSSPDTDEDADYLQVASYRLLQDS